MSLLLRLLVLVFLLSSCGGHQPARVSDRQHKNKSARVVLQRDSKPDIYRVRSGDTLYSIGFRYGVDYHKLAAWNHIKAPFTIYVGLRLRMTKPVGFIAANDRAQPKKNGTNALKKQTSSAKPKTTHAKTTSVKKNYVKPKPVIKTKTTKKKTYSVSNSKAKWRWPIKGTLITRFSTTDNSRNGIDISGKIGSSVKAAAAGVVVYAGNGLPSYGELIIIKHNDTYLSAYAHNKERKVKEGDKVKSGQVISTLGKTGTDRPKLHFEIRYKGKPVDPLKYLPKL